MEEHKKGDEHKHFEEEFPVRKSGHSKSFTETIRGNPWILSTIIFGILFLGFLVAGMVGNISGKQAGEKLVNFVETQTGQTSEVLETKSFDSNFYEVTLSFQGQEIPAYVTKDGKYFVTSLTLLDIPKTEVTKTPPKEAPKSDRPKAELFVMTYCPYGTQAEKGFIPMIKAMNDSIDSKIRFVHYFMHGDPEENETYVQVCLREEQSPKYLDYLTCFLEDGNSSRCLKQTKVDVTKMNICIKNGKAKEYYAQDSNLSNSYGVQGSPSLVINGQMVQSGRSPGQFLQAVCLAFNVAPGKCASLNLSTQSPAPMWGWNATSTSGASAAQCA